MTTTVQEFDHSLDVLRSVLWAYNEAENLQALLTKKQAWYDANHVDFWDDWVVNVFDMRTANDFGLAVWSVILDLPLFGDNTVSPTTYLAFGFDTGEVLPATSPIRAFQDPAQPLATGGNFATDTRGAFGIPTEQKRILLRLRYFQLVTRGALPEVNRFLLALLGPNELYALDGLDMTMTYVIVGPTSRNMLQLFELFDILPRPAGVRVNYTIESLQSFGFDEFNLNFDNGSFVEQQR